MNRRRQSHPTPFYQGKSALLLLILLVAGCALATTTGTVTPPPLAPEGPRALDKAQKLFNEAGGLDQPATSVPEASLQKYRQVANIVEQEVLGKVDKPLEMNAYGLLAFSQWRLGNYAKAMEAGNQGRQIYETQKLTSNRREYGMCLMVGGLCLASQTYKEYENLQGPPTKELRRSLTGRLEQAMQALDAVNTRLDRGEDIVVYANLWQLSLVDAAVRIWTSEGLSREVWQPEVCRWLGRAEPVFAKLPPTPYPQETLTATYKNKFERRQREYCQGR